MRSIAFIAAAEGPEKALNYGVTKLPVGKVRPRLAPPALAQKILTRVQALSKPFGATITIENNVGVIRIDQSRSTAAGFKP